MKWIGYIMCGIGGAMLGTVLNQLEASGSQWVVALGGFIVAQLGIGVIAISGFIERELKKENNG